MNDNNFWCAHLKMWWHMRMPGRTYLKKPCFRFLLLLLLLKAYLKQQTHQLCWCKVSGDNHVTEVSVRLYKGYMSQNPTNIQEQKTLGWSSMLVFRLFVLLTSLCYLHVFSRRWDWYVGASLAVWYLSQWQDWGMRFPTFVSHFTFNQDNFNPTLSQWASFLLNVSFKFNATYLIWDISIYMQTYMEILWYCREFFQCFQSFFY